MIADQLIYTACGKEKKGDFSIWSKSEGITKEEANEIIKLMSYKVMDSNLPYEPTEEELDQLFPKKYGYFILSSGRVCLALSCYLGKVYSDFDLRMGNFIIHAFVLNELGNLNPFYMIESPLFKKKLTYSEWHDHPAPEYLPQVNLQNGPITNITQKIKNGLSRIDIHNFEFLYQGLQNALFNGESLVLNDYKDSLLFWYELIGYVFPFETIKKLTFCSMYRPSSYQQEFEEIPVVLKNIPTTISTSLFNYDVELMNGKYVYDFENRRINDSIEISLYTKTVAEKLKYEFEKIPVYVEKTQSLAFKYKCSLDEACEISDFLQNNQNKYTSKRILHFAETISNAGFIREVILIFQRKLFELPIDSDWLKLIHFLYENLDLSVKYRAYDVIFNKTEELGVFENEDPTKYVQDFIKLLPCKPREFYQYLKQSKTNEIFQRDEAFCRKYLYITLASEAYGSHKQNDDKRIICEQLNRLILSLKDKYVLLVCRSFKNFGIEIEDILEACMNTILVNHLNFVLAQPIFICYVLEQMSPTNSLQFFEILYTKMNDISKFSNVFSSREKANPAYYKAIMSLVKDNTILYGFLQRQYINDFKKTEAVSLSDLDAYYKRIYVKVNQDNDIFSNQLLNYLKQEVQDCKKGMELLKKYFPKPAKRADLDCIEKVLKYLVGLDLKEIAHDRGKVFFLYEYNKKIMENHYKAIPEIIALKDGLMLLNTIEEMAQERKNCFGEPEFSSEYRKIIIKYYLPDLIFGCSRLLKKQIHFAEILDKFLLDLSKEKEEFYEAVPKALERLDEQSDKSYYLIFIKYYLLYATQERFQPEFFFLKTMNIYLEQCGVRKVKKVISPILNLYENDIKMGHLSKREVEKVKEYISLYQKKNYSFMDKLLVGYIVEEKSGKNSK